MPGPQFTLRALLVAMLVVGAFLGGMRFERERKRREDEEAILAARGAAAKSAMPVPFFPLTGPLVIRSGEVRKLGVQSTRPLDFARQNSPHIEALELRGFEGMTPRAVE